MKADSVNDLLTWNPPPIIPIIDGGILYPQNKLFIYGRYKSWKSMLAMHTSVCLALGLPWFGFKTQQSQVLMVQVELPKFQYKTRIGKYIAGNNLLLADGVSKVLNFHIASEPYIKLDRGFGHTALEQEIQRLHPGVLVIDPLYKVVSGRISDEYDMRQFTDRMDILIEKYKLAVIIIHHDRKEIIMDGKAVNLGSQDMFGTSIFMDWCDTAIKLEVQQDDAEILVIPDIVRHGTEEIKPFKVQVDRNTLQFRIKPEELGGNPTPT